MMPELSGIGLATAFLAGAVSFLSPCVLPLVPGYVSYIAGRPAVGTRVGDSLARRLSAAGLSLAFVLGFSTVFVILGASATALGQMLIGYRYEMNIIGGAVVILFGLFVSGLVAPSWMMRDLRFGAEVQGGKAVSAYVLGLAFAFGWTPCIGPILGAILTVGAASATVSDGVALLGVYSLGLGVPFLLSAVFTDALTTRLKTIGRIGRTLRIAAGAVMIAMGAAMITGYLTEFSYWLLATFPVLSRIG